MSLSRRAGRALSAPRGLFLVALVAGGLTSVGFLGVGGSGSHTVTATFSNVNGLVTGNEVRVAGIIAGEVTSVQISIDPSSGNQVAVVQMGIDASHWPLHQGTRLAVKPKGVLSNVFVDLQPGSVHNPALGDNPTFDISQTQSPVNLDELTNVFTPTVRDAIRTQLQEGVLAFSGAGATDLNVTIANANPLTLDSIPVTDVLATRSPQLDNLNFEFDTITGDLAREDANLRPLISNLDTTLGALAAREVQLQGTLVHAANVFTDLSQALSSPGTQADLARIFQQSPQALTCAAALSTYLNPVITAVNPYISYKAPLSLNTLLADFITATGFNTSAIPGLPPVPSDTLRANNFLALPGYTSTDNGGLTLEHGSYRNATLNGKSVYADQPPLTGPSAHPVLAGCQPPPGLP